MWEQSKGIDMELESAQFESGASWDIEPYPWKGFGFLGKLIALFLPLLAAGLLILPFLDHALLRRLARLPALGGLVDWLVNDGGSWIAGVALLVVWLGFLLFKRWRLVSNEHLWVDAGCPQCLEHELVRVSRERSDRWYGLLRIPAFRYACRNCTWRGLRIARRHRHVVLAQEELIVASSVALEAAGAATSAVGAESTAVPDVTFDDLTAYQEEELAEIAELADVELTVEPAETPQEPDTELAEEALEQPANHKASGGLPSDDDLDWLWRRLSDDT